MPNVITRVFRSGRQSSDYGIVNQKQKESGQGPKVCGCLEAKKKKKEGEGENGLSIKTPEGMQLGCCHLDFI